MKILVLKILGYTIPIQKIKSVQGFSQPCDNIVIKPHVTNLFLKHVTTLSQPCDKFKTKLLIQNFQGIKFLGCFKNHDVYIHENFSPRKF